MLCHAIPVLLIATCFAAILPAQEHDRRSLPIPGTISTEAQEFLKKAPLPPPPLESLQDWERLQEQIEREGRKQSQQVLASLGTETDIRTMGKVDVHIVTPKSLDASNQNKALVHVHGGGYCLHSSASSYAVCAPIAELTGLKVYCIDYRLAPQHPFPEGLEDCIAAYKQIIQDVSPDNLGVFGASAGGGIVLPQKDSCVK